MIILEKKKNKKNIWGKLKVDYQLAQYWKNKFDKDNFLKKYIGEFLKKKNYKAKLSTNLI